MRKALTILVVFVALLFVGACHNSNGQSSAKVKALASSSQNKAAETTAERDVKKCVPNLVALTPLHRAKTKQCLETVVPKAQRANVEKCALDAALSDVHKPNGKQQFESTDLGNCVNKYVR